MVSLKAALETAFRGSFTVIVNEPVMDLTTGFVVVVVEVVVVPVVVVAVVVDVVLVVVVVVEVVEVVVEVEVVMVVVRAVVVVVMGMVWPGNTEAINLSLMFTLLYPNSTKKLLEDRTGTESGTLIL